MLVSYTILKGMNYLILVFGFLENVDHAGWFWTVVQVAMPYKQIVIYGGMQRISSLKLRFRGWIT